MTVQLSIHLNGKIKPDLAPGIVKLVRAHAWTNSGFADGFCYKLLLRYFRRIKFTCTSGPQFYERVFCNRRDNESSWSWESGVRRKRIPSDCLGAYLRARYYFFGFTNNSFDLTLLDEFKEGIWFEGKFVDCYACGLDTRYKHARTKLVRWANYEPERLRALVEERARAELRLVNERQERVRLKAERREAWYQALLHPPKKIKHVVCATCSKQFDIVANNLKNSKTCSFECKVIHHKKVRKAWKERQRQQGIKELSGAQRRKSSLNSTKQPSLNSTKQQRKREYYDGMSATVRAACELGLVEWPKSGNIREMTEIYNAVKEILQ